MVYIQGYTMVGTIPGHIGRYPPLYHPGYIGRYPPLYHPGYTTIPGMYTTVLPWVYHLRTMGGMLGVPYPLP